MDFAITVAVFSGSSRNTLCFGNGGDIMQQQVFPSNTWGTRYLTYHTLANANSDLITPFLKYLPGSRTGSFHHCEKKWNSDDGVDQYISTMNFPAIRVITLSLTNPYLLHSLCLPPTHVQAMPPILMETRKCFI